MKKISILFAFAIIVISALQCTEDETVEASVGQAEKYTIESGEEGDQELDNDRD